MNSALHLVRLVDPEICLECPFASLMQARVGKRQYPIVRCTRRDCDNWETRTIEPFNGELQREEKRARMERRPYGER